MNDDEDDNPVLAYKKAYDEEHPIDNSLTGTLARISGQTKDDVAFLLEYIDYSTKIANYHPETRYSFTGTPQEIIYNFESITLSTEPSTIISINHIFTDRRNYLV
jgi:hypothetical protein